MENKELFEKLDEFGKKMVEFKDDILKKHEDLSKRVEEIEVKINRPQKAPMEEEKIEMKKAFLNFVRTGKLPEIKALVEDAGTAAVLVPEDYYSEIITSLPHRAIVRKLAKSIPVKGNKLNVRSLGDITMGWGKLETGTSVTESTPTVAKEALEIFDLNGLVKLGRDLLADTDIALERYILDSFSRKIAYYEDYAFILGDGSDKPTGVLNDSNITEVTSANAGSIDLDDIIDMYYALKEEYRSNAVWVMSSATEKTLRKIKTSDGEYLLQRDLASPTGRSILGRPIYNFDDMPAISGGNSPVLFGDFTNGFIILDKQNGMTVQRLEELYATNGQVGLLIVHRVGGGVIVPEAFAKLTVQS